MKEYFGETLINQSKAELKEHFKMEVNNIRTFFEMLDTRVAELKQIGGTNDLPKY